jgi:hypothetical protein
MSKMKYGNMLEVMDWIDLSQWWAFVNTLKDVWVL